MKMDLRLKAMEINQKEEIHQAQLQEAQLFIQGENFLDEEKKGIKIVCSDKNIPTDKSNICHKVAKKFFEVSGKKIGLTIKIKKWSGTDVIQGCLS